MNIETRFDAPVSEEPATSGEAALIRKLTCFDGLTGLPNRVLFREQLDLLLRIAQRNAVSMAVMLVDIDDFRRIKTSLGRTQSEAVIKTISSRLANSLRASDVLAGGSGEGRTPSVARMDGNEFAIVLNNLREPYDAHRVAQRVREAVSALLMVGEVEIFPSLSIGVALFPGDGDDAETLIEHADVALGQAKEQGKDRVQFYDLAANDRAVDQLALESQMRRGLREGEFFPVFQPKIDCRTGQLCGMEALVRWQHPVRGLLTPLAFIDAAEKSRLIAPIGEFMLDAACRQNVAWQKLGLPPVPVSVNVSAVQVARPDFVKVISDALERSGMEAQWLELEVTESLLVSDAAGALRTFSAIKAMGVRISIDDFGTGFSSLAYLRDFPFDVLKIDRSFVSGLPDATRTAGLVCAIIDLSRRLSLEVVAEGVETPAQAAFLNANGCHLLQGYGYCRPVTAQVMEQYWRDRLQGLNAVLQLPAES
jgi:diguanylate cyclase (GGDEF)-like protein